jgi:hypothetical protein
LSAILLAGTLIGCKATVTGIDLSGTWGGPHIELRLLGDSATLEYDCAHGKIEEPLRPDSRGRFQATGVHVREHGGPIHEDETPDEHPASYTGRTDGHEMTLTVALTDTDERVGTFLLVRGRAGIVFKCL